jgi:hypothetical protein
MVWISRQSLQNTAPSFFFNPIGLRLCDQYWGNFPFKCDIICFANDSKTRVSRGGKPSSEVHIVV